MAGNVTIRVTVRGEESVKDLLDDMDRRSKDFRPVFNKAENYLEKANRDNFAASGLPAGGWRPLDAQYGAWKTTKFPGVPLMVKSGELFSSLSSLNNSAKSVRLTTAEFGTKVEYAKFHQYGTNKMPKRKIVFEPPRFARDIGVEAAKHIVGK